MLRFLFQIRHPYNSNIPRSSYTLSPLSNPQRIARSSAIMVATTPSIFSVDFSLSCFIFPAGSVFMKILSIPKVYIFPWNQEKKSEKAIASSQRYKYKYLQEDITSIFPSLLNINTGVISYELCRPKEINSQEINP